MSWRTYDHPIEPGPDNLPIPPTGIEALVYILQVIAERLEAIEDTIREIAITRGELPDD